MCKAKELKSSPIPVSTIYEIGLDLHKKKERLKQKQEELFKKKEKQIFIDAIPTYHEIKEVQGKIIAYQEILDELHPLVFRDETLCREVELFRDKVLDLSKYFDLDMTIEIEYEDDFYFVRHNIKDIWQNYSPFYKLVSNEMNERFFSKNVSNVCFYFDYELYKSNKTN